MARKRYIAIIGATASGKSALAMDLARRYQGELINCDSVQIYRGFNLGAAKPTREEMAEIPHHLIDIADWNEPFDARQFATAAEAAVQDVSSRGKLPIIVGGTGLYLRALWQDTWHDLPKDASLRTELATWSLERLAAELQNLDPRRAAEIHGNDRFRLQRAVEVAKLLGHSIKDLAPLANKQNEALVIAMNAPRPYLQARIAARSRKMIDAGLIDEVKGLLAQGADPDSKPMQSIGYHEVVRYLRGEIELRNLEEAIIIATRQYAKRQDTLFRKFRVDLSWEPSTTFVDFERLWND